MTLDRRDIFWSLAVASLCLILGHQLGRSGCGEAPPGAGVGVVASPVARERPVAQRRTTKRTPPPRITPTGEDPAPRDLALVTAGERSFVERPPDEWQGMLVDETEPAFCYESSDCGLARACRDGACVACEIDEDCAPGEGCALDHCLLEELIQCHSVHQCGPDELCVLSGYSAAPRGNEDMEALCYNTRQVSSPSAEDDVRPPIWEAEARPVGMQELLDDLEQWRKEQ